MDPITHVLSGAALAMAAPGRPKSRLFVVFGAVCAAFPDIDVAFGRTAESVMTLHRGFTHSIFLAPLFAIGLAFLASKIMGGRLKWTVPRLAVLATLCLWLHTLLDCLTSFGTMALLPFSAQRLFVPSLFIVDPLYTLMLGALLVLAALKARRGMPEMTLTPPSDMERPSPPGHRWAAAAVCWIFLWPALSLGAHQAAAAETKRTELLPGSPTLHVLPDAFSPLYWKVVAQTDDAYYQGLYRLGSGQIHWNTAAGEGLAVSLPVAPDAPLAYPRPSPELLARLAKESPMFKEYEGFAMFIVEEKAPWPAAVAARADLENAICSSKAGRTPPEPDTKDTLLVLRDLRLDSVMPLAAKLRNSNRVFQAVALLSPQGHLKTENFIGNPGRTSGWKVYPEN